MMLAEQTTSHLDADYTIWLKQNSTSYTIIDKETSELFRDRYHSKIKACYTNCWKIAICEPEYSFYIGHVSALGLPLSHAFLVKDNKVIDPTLAIKVDDRERYGTEYYGMPINKHSYVRLRGEAHWDDLIPNYIYRSGLTKNREGGESE